MKITKREIWESGAALQRFGQLKLKGKALIWKAGRIHRAASKVLESLQEENQEAVRTFGTEVKWVDRQGNPRTGYQVPTGTQAARDYKVAWEKVLDEPVEFWGDPISTEELGAHLEELSNEDVGALADWLIVDGEAK